jgi:hypothetical protein
MYKSSVCLHHSTGLNKFSFSEIPTSEYLFVSAVSILDINSIILDFWDNLLMLDFIVRKSPILGESKTSTKLTSTSKVPL